VKNCERLMPRLREIACCAWASVIIPSSAILRRTSSRRARAAGLLRVGE
jgi:hypothetical protein